MNALNRKSKNRDRNVIASNLGVKALVAGVAVTAACIGSFTPFNEPVWQPIKVEAATVNEAVVVGSNNALVINTETVDIPLVEPISTAITVEDTSQEATMAVLQPVTVEYSNVKLVGSEEMGASLQSVEDAENPEIKAQREAEEKAMADEEILQRYSFALHKSDGSRNDLTPDLLRLAEQCCAEQGLDTNLYLSLIMTESEGNARAKNKSSTATGLGQILKGTGKYVYEDLMGNGKGTYNHSMAYDPALNIRMTTTYLGNLKRQRGSMYAALQSYRGKKDISGYTGRMNAWLNKSGLSVHSYI